MCLSYLPDLVITHNVSFKHLLFDHLHIQLTSSNTQIPVMLIRSSNPLILLPFHYSLCSFLSYLM